MNNIRYFSRRSQRGSVMILVVAVLGLLAVIGTVYVVAARSQRGTSAALSASANLNLARDAIMTQVQQVIGNSMIDAAGQVGGYSQTDPSDASHPYGDQVARLYDYPELGPIYGQLHDGAMRDEPWLVAKIHRQSAADADLTQITSSPFNPSTGTYSGAWQPFAVTLKTDTVVADQTINDNTTDDGPTAAVIPDSYINLLPFSDASGIRYRFGLRIIDTNRMANLNTGATNDSMVTSQDLVGTHLTSMRLAPGAGVLPTPNAYFNAIDTGGNLQYNTGGLGRVSGPSTMGNTSFSLANWQTQILSYEQPTDTGVAFFDLADELELRSYGEYGTSFRCRPSIPGPSGTFIMWPNTLTVNPTNKFSSLITGNAARRNYTTYSFSRQPRPYPDPIGTNVPFTLSYATGTYADGSVFQQPADFPTDFGSPSQSIYPHATTLGYAAQVWPTSPPNGTTAFHATALPRVAINPPLIADSTTANQALQHPSEQNWTTMYHVAMAATNVATAMERCSGYLHREACSFAANYATSLWSGMMQDPDVVVPSTPGAPSVAFYFPSGPSFVDATGLCIRTAISANSIIPPTDASITQIGADFGGNTSDLSSTSVGGNTHLGYLAQPFINKIAAQSTSTGAGGGASAITLNDSAIELFNPYGVPLSMRGYHLVDTTTAMDLDLTQDDASQKLYVPANGFLIITTGTGSPLLAPTPTGTPPTSVVAKYAAFKLSLAGSATLSLRRPFWKRNSLISTMATVDRAAYAGVDAANTIFAPSSTAVTASLFTGRADSTIATSMGTPAIVSTASPFTLGTTAGAPTYNLYDRATLTSVSPTPITNIADFNRIMRIGNVIDGSGNPVIPSATTPNGLLPERLGALGVSPDTSPDTPAQYPNEPKEAIIYFDFWVNPKVYGNSAIYPVAISPPTTPVPTDPDHKCDMRAFVLLDCLAPIDRYSNYSINIGNSNPDITKLRLPGQINVNTASGDVLRALPGISNAPTPNQVVANILAYRNRKAGNASDPNASYGGIPSSQDYSDNGVGGNYPGMGIRSLGELLVPIHDAIGAVPTSLAVRDQIWADVYNLCTVRSDTFAVYGYLEAVRQNPSYPSASFNNATSWYSTVTDDPHNTTNPLLRVAR